MNKGIILAGILAVALAAQSAGAKTLEEVLKEKGVITEADYNDIMKDKPKTPPISYKLGQGMTFTTPDQKFQLSIGGQMQMRYTFSELDGPSNPPYNNSNQSQWRMQRIKTYFNGYAFTQDLTYKINLAWNQLTNYGNSSRLLEECFLNYRIVDEAQLRVGQDKVQYSRQWITSSSQNEFVDTSFVTSAFTPTYDMGLAVNGSALKGLLTYSAAWLGGNGQSTTANDNNNSYNLRLGVNPLGEMKYGEADIDMSPKPLLGLGGTYYHDTLKYTTITTGASPAPANVTAGLETNNLGYAQSTGWLGKNIAMFALPAPSLASGWGNATQNINVDMFQADMAFKWMGLFAQAEYFWGEGTGQTATVYTNPKGTKGFGQPTVISNGFYAQVGYMVVPKTVELAFRYNWLDYNKAQSLSIQTQVQGAISWYIQGHNLKIQADVTKANTQANARTDRYAVPLTVPNNSTGPYVTANSLSDTIFRAQVQLMF
jgi:phosphate-selective porin OprO/OprP